MQCGGFPRLGVPFLGSLLGVYMGSPDLGNYHVALMRLSSKRDEKSLRHTVDGGNLAPRALYTLPLGPLRTTPLWRS